MRSTLAATFLLLAALAPPPSPARAQDPPGPTFPPTPALTPIVPPVHYGPTWPIQEEDMRQTIQERYRTRLPEFKRQLEDSVRQYTIPFLPRPTTDTARTIEIDPSLEVTQPITTPDGRLLARPGDRLNPLRGLLLLRTYFIVNTADPRQLAWVREAVRTVPMAMVLLTEGDLVATRAALPVTVPAYPAPAQLVERFPIDSVPAMLRRVGDRLTLTFIPEEVLSDVLSTPAQSAAP